MAGNEDARKLLEAFAGWVEPDPTDGASSQDRPPRLATVAPGYTTGNASVIFDGESLATVKTYPTLDRIRAGQRVVLLPVGNGYVIIGAIGSIDPTPVGSIIEGLWATAPLGYLLMDGTVVLRADYPDLFAVVGTTYNTGGETGAQFRLPASRGRVTVQRLAGNANFDVLGAVGGVESVTLTANQSGLRGHSHPVGGTGTGFIANGAGGSGANVTTGGGGYQLAAPQAVAAANAVDAHANLQPFIVVNRAIRY